MDKKNKLSPLDMGKIISNEHPILKIMVNWNKQNIIHCSAHRGSVQYTALLKRGYVEVGNIKSAGIEPFWEPANFNPRDKYIPEQNQDNA